MRITGLLKKKLEGRGRELSRKSKKGGRGESEDRYRVGANAEKIQRPLPKRARDGKESKGEHTPMLAGFAKKKNYSIKGTANKAVGKCLEGRTEGKTKNQGGDPGTGRRPTTA